MDVTGLLIFLAIGAVAGWLAGTLMKGGGFGLLGNIVIGIIGAVVGGFVFGLPPSLVLAQTAEESGWGASRFAVEGNALFGLWTWGDDPADHGR